MRRRRKKLEYYADELALILIILSIIEKVIVIVLKLINEQGQGAVSPSLILLYCITELCIEKEYGTGYVHCLLQISCYQQSTQFLISGNEPS